MRVVVQRVSTAGVLVDGVAVAEIGWGALVLVGVEKGDTEREAELLAAKVARAQLFPKRSKSMARNVFDFGGALLVVSEVTLAGDVVSAHRPSFLTAAAAADAERLYLHFARRLGAEARVPVRTGRFGAAMEVSLVNDGPVTFVLTCRPGGGVE